MSVNFTTADRVGVVGGYIGGISSLLNGVHGGTFGTFGAGQQYVGRETFDLSLQLASSQRDNAILASELNTEKKMVEVFNASVERSNKYRDELLSKISAVEAKVDAGFASQAVINCQTGSAVALLQNQVGQLFRMTKMVIPSDNVCPKPMPEFNSWTAPTT